MRRRPGSRVAKAAPGAGGNYSYQGREHRKFLPNLAAESRCRPRPDRIAFPRPPRVASSRKVEGGFLHSDPAEIDDHDATARRHNESGRLPGRCDARVLRQTSLVRQSRHQIYRAARQRQRHRALISRASMFFSRTWNITARRNEPCSSGHRSGPQLREVYQVGLSRKAPGCA